MIKIIKADRRHFSGYGWLKTHWLFSFSNYYDPENIQFGALRVFNDDEVQPGTGFPTHPHREMEIITIVLSGEITHEDSMGNKSVIKAGDVQRMSAGTGLTHSEVNRGDRPAHFHQIWFYPEAFGLEPSYEQKSFSDSSWKNYICPIASGKGFQDVVTMNANATVFRAELHSGRSLSFDTDSTRRLFVYVMSGDLEINAQKLSECDQARIDDVADLSLKTEGGAHFIIVDVASCRGWGYESRVYKGMRVD